MSTACALAVAACLAVPAAAQTLTLLRNIDAPQYDPARTSAGATALDPKARFEAFAKVQKIVHENALWVPLVHEGLALVVNKRVKNVRAHHVYTSMIYKALDASP